MNNNQEGLFSDLELLEIHKKNPHKQNYNTVPDTSSGVKQKQSNEKELPTPANENTTLPNDILPSNQENVKRIIISEKTILPSLRNIQWKTLKIETD